MIVNGSSQDTIAINDRGLAYGDGVFETILIHRHHPILLQAHLDRLESGSSRLKISLDRTQLEQEIADYSPHFPEQGVLKIIVTRGAGGRGYRPLHSSDTTRILSLHSLPVYEGDPGNSGIATFICNQRLAIQPTLSGIKHLNRLEQVLASQEWLDESFMEGIMLDSNDNVIEGTRSNIFWSESGRLFTPTLSNCGVAGIMRNYLLNSIAGAAEINGCSLDRLVGADEIFICNSVFGIWPVRSIQAGSKTVALDVDGSEAKFTRQAQSLFQELLKADAA